MKDKKYFQCFTVKGSWAFPLDMLRYDHCFPTGEGLECISLSIRGIKPERHQSYSIRLGRWVDRWSQIPTLGRWASFGWYVDADSIVTDVDGEMVSYANVTEWVSGNEVPR